MAFKSVIFAPWIALPQALGSIGDRLRGGPWLDGPGSSESSSGVSADAIPVGLRLEGNLARALRVPSLGLALIVIPVGLRLETDAPG